MNLCELCRRKPGRARRPPDANGKERTDVVPIDVCDPCFERATVELPDLRARYEALVDSGVDEDAAAAMMLDLMRKGAPPA